MSDAKPAKRPNILFITADQQRGDCFGFAGRAVKTPHLDRLAADGTWLRNCITPNLVCQPSRASILTGKLPLTHGVVDNGIDLRPARGEDGFAGQLARAGYRTGYVGKAHFSTCSNFDPTGTPECGASSADFAADCEMRVGILTGAGRAFSAGADLKEMAERNARQEGNTGFVTQFGTTLTAMQFSKNPKPFIAAINGICIAGGFER